jgi:hypothetical protein
MATKRTGKLTAFELEDLTVRMHERYGHALQELKVFDYQAKMLNSTTVGIKGTDDKLVFQYVINNHNSYEFANTIERMVPLLEARDDYMLHTGKDLLPENGAYDALNNHFAQERFSYGSLYLNTINDAGETKFLPLSEKNLERYAVTYEYALEAVQRSENKDAIASLHFANLYQHTGLDNGQDMTRMTSKDSFATVGSMRETDEGLELTTTLHIITNQDGFDTLLEEGEDWSQCTLPLHHHEQVYTWAELEATGGLTEAAYREQVKTKTPYEACAALYNQRVYVENENYDAFEFELTRDKAALMKGLLENNIDFYEYNDEYKIEGSRVATHVTLDDEGITFQPTFKGESWSDYGGAPPSKEFVSREPVTLSWDDLESQFGITKASFEAAKLLEEDPMQAMKVAYAARHNATESYSMDFSEPEQVMVAAPSTINEFDFGSEETSHQKQSNEFSMGGF